MKKLHPEECKPNIQSKRRRDGLVATLMALGVEAATGSALAAPGTISQIPLYVGPNVEPNVTFVADDSGSMEFTILVPENDGAMWLGGRAYYYTHPTTSCDSTSWRTQNYTYKTSYTYQSGRALVVPTYEKLVAVLGRTAADASGVWRAWNAHYNTVYYDPAVTYTPWAGLNKSGVAYTNANPAAAPLNPYDPALGTVNLTAETTYCTTYPGQSNTNMQNITLYPARYYAWTDTNNDGVVDPGDAHVLVEITDHATTLTPASQVPTLYYGGPNRTDCAARPYCTYAEEIQNFANWFSYYRSHDLALKNAASKSIAELTGVRIGFATINNNAANRLPVASMNLSPATGNKKTLFDKIFQTLPASGTPLRNALYKTGLYYECKSGNIMGVSGSGCPILPAAQGGMCQRNYTILMTDGFWNDWSNPPLGVPDADRDMHTAWDGPPYADGYSYTLADVAMYFYARDLNTSLADQVPAPTGARDNAPHQHMTTFTVGFGLEGTLDPASDPAQPGFAWTNPFTSDPAKIDDLWHAAYNGRGDYFSAKNPQDLESGIRAAFASVARGKSSSSSVAFNTTQLGTNSTLYQASFNPSNDWAGSLVATSLGANGQLGGQLWNAADVLDATAPPSRVMITYNESTKTGIPFRTLSSLSTRQQNDLNMGPSGVADGQGQARLDYLRGDRSNEGTIFRTRGSVLGDIVYSNPVYVGMPELGYADDPSFGDGRYSVFRTNHINRTPVVYVGANDGTLHGFRASDGAEVLSYVPNILFSSASKEGLHFLTDPAYDHRYYVDLSPTVADVYINGAWRTILVGGYRAGGRGLFALDITDPSTFSETNADNIVLWEFTGNDDSGLGYTFSKPTIALLQNDRWAVVFGNGYNDAGDGQAKLYIVYVDGAPGRTWTSSGYVVIPTGVGSPSNRNGLSTPALVDSDGDGKADRVYAGDLMGNLWAFDLSSPSASNWRVAYKTGNTARPLFNAAIGATAQPITSKPVIARNPAVATAPNNAPNILVFFGTGQYLVDGDKGSIGTQTFYGVWDNGGPAGQLPRTRTDLIAQTLDSAHSTADLRVTTDNAVDYGSQYGWMFDLPTSGERVVVDPKVRGDYVFFNTLIPDPGTCNSKGYGWLMALKLVNGGSPRKPVFDVNRDGQVDTSDLLGGTYRPSGLRMDKIPAGSNFLDDVMYTPDDEGNIDVRVIDAGIMIESGRVSWREIRRGTQP
jgi:type IV pilus assembly protein PilY1